ncbi:hypothetical protein ACIA47_15060 [Micromonospora sp. NPDC051227]|uniref:hypothetical protein n=1 Tax=Micromonospora sp. NPDC051227 TaxID=3364285 RepID=UPI00379C7889
MSKTALRPNMPGGKIVDARIDGCPSGRDDIGDNITDLRRTHPPSDVPPHVTVMALVQLGELLLRSVHHTPYVLMSGTSQNVTHRNEEPPNLAPAASTRRAQKSGMPKKAASRRTLSAHRPWDRRPR